MRDKDETTGQEANGTDVRSVCVVGLGYIGLPTAAMFAANGLQVHGIDIDQRAVDTVNSGQAHIEEGDLDELVAKVVATGKLRAHTGMQPADAFIIAVPTPVTHDESHRPDLTYVMAAGRAIAPVLKQGDLVILESTSPVGTTRQLSELLAGLRSDLSFPHAAGEKSDVCLAYCPERIIPGRMLRELVDNDRIIGGMTARCSHRAAGLYRNFVEGECLLTDDKTAEMVKLAENSFRDVNIAFANELSMICDGLGMDPWRVIELANRHPRVSILNPGPGVGGHCIAVDPWFIVASAPERAKLIRAARETNDRKPWHVVEKVEALIAERPDARIACLGLAYKPDVDDFRESPALAIASELTRRHPGRVVCCDPYQTALGELGEGLSLRELDTAVDSDILVILVGHAAFRDIAPRVDVEIVDTVGLRR